VNVIDLDNMFEHCELRDGIDRACVIYSSIVNI
jgi:hypothetical protein